MVHSCSHCEKGYKKPSTFPSPHPASYSPILLASCIKLFPVISYFKNIRVWLAAATDYVFNTWQERQRLSPFCSCSFSSFISSSNLVLTLDSAVDHPCPQLWICLQTFQKALFILRTVFNLGLFSWSSKHISFNSQSETPSRKRDIFWLLLKKWGKKEFTVSSKLPLVIVLKK